MAEQTTQTTEKSDLISKGSTKTPCHIAALESLMDMCDQYLPVTNDIDSLLHHDFMSAGENALKVLEDEGLASEVGGEKYRLNYDKLKLMKDSIERNDNPPPEALN